MYISLWENYQGHPDNISFMQFSTKIDGFEQKDSQGFENSYNSYEQYPLEKFFIFTIYQNYTLALTIKKTQHILLKENVFICQSTKFNSSIKVPNKNKYIMWLRLLIQQVKGWTLRSLLN